VSSRWSLYNRLSCNSKPARVTGTQFLADPFRASMAPHADLRATHSSSVVSEVHLPNANGVQSSSPGLPELVEGYPGSARHDQIHNPARVGSCSFNPYRVAAAVQPGDPG